MVPADRWTVLAIAVVALNLRPAVVAVSPLVDTIRADTGLSAAATGLLTTLPILGFSAFALIGPILARRAGLEVTVAVALVLVSGGILVRLVPSLVALYLGSAMAGSAIAVINVLIPALIKRDFARAGPMTGAYTSCLNVGAGLASGLTVPLLHGLGWTWRQALASWGVLALVGLAAWVPVWRRRPPLLVDGVTPTHLGGFALLADPLARQVIVFLGMQSSEFYSFVAWFPTLLHSHGVSTQTGGALLAVSTVVGAAGALTVPASTGRFRTQQPLVVAVVACYLAALVGLLVAPAGGAVAWARLFGLAQGAGFALAITLVVLRSPDHRTAGALSGIAQCCGYLVAAGGPFVLGFLHDLTGGWESSFTVLVVALAPMLWGGLGAGAGGQVRHPGVWPLDVAE